MNEKIFGYFVLVKVRLVDFFKIDQARSLLTITLQLQTFSLFIPGRFLFANA